MRTFMKIMMSLLLAVMSFATANAQDSLLTIKFVGFDGDTIVAEMPQELSNEERVAFLLDIFEQTMPTSITLSDENLEELKSFEAFCFLPETGGLLLFNKGIPCFEWGPGLTSGLTQDMVNPISYHVKQKTYRLHFGKKARNLHNRKYYQLK